MDILLIIGAVVLSIVGIIGCLLPALPGPPFSFVALLLIHFSKYVDISSTTLWILGGLTLVVTILDYVIPIWGTKRYGGTKYGARGTTIGLIVGFFAGPMGMIAGPFIGAMLGEMMGGRQDKGVLRAACGSFIGFLVGIGLKLTMSLILFFYLLTYLLPIIF